MVIIMNVDIDDSFAAGLKSRCGEFHNELNYLVRQELGGNQRVQRFHLFA